MTTPNKLCQHDLCYLILRFFTAVREGKPYSLATFKQVWKDLHFSWIFQVMPRSFTFDQYVQLLYSTLLDALLTGFPRQTVYDVTMEVKKKNEPTQSQEEEEEDTDYPGPSNPATARGSIEDDSIAPELRHLLFEDLPPAPPSSSQQQQQQLTAIPEEEEEWQLVNPNLNLQIASLFALFCLFHAQPSHSFPQVKIYLSKEHQAALSMTLKNLSEAAEEQQQQHNIVEALTVVRYLLDNAFVLGGGSSAQSDTTKTAEAATTHRSQDYTSARKSKPSPRAAEEEAILREVRFQLSSALKGLGTKFLPPMYDDYREKLQHVWKVVTAPPPPSSSKRSDGTAGGDEGSLSLEQNTDTIIIPPPQPQPQPISDLSLGKLLNQYVEYKGAEVQYLLKHGKKWRIRKLAREIPKSAGKMETEAVKSLSTGVFKSNQLQIIAEEEEEEEEDRETTKSGIRKSVQIEATEDDIDKQQQAHLKGLPPSARRALEREVKRKQEIQKRAKAWIDRVPGIDPAHLAAAASGGSFEAIGIEQQQHIGTNDDEDEDSLMEDMPSDIPGLPDWVPPSATAATLSMYTYNEDEDYDDDDEEDRGRGRQGAAAAAGGGGGVSTGRAFTEATVEQQQQQQLLEGEENPTQSALPPKQGSGKGKGKRSSNAGGSKKKKQKLKPVDTKKLESVLAEQAEIVKRTLAEAEDYDDFD